MDLNSLPNGGTCPSDFGVSRRVTKLFWSIWTVYRGRPAEYEHVILVLIMDHCQPYETTVLTVFIQDHYCVALSTSGVFLNLRQNQRFVLMRMISEDV